MSKNTLNTHFYNCSEFFLFERRTKMATLKKSNAKDAKKVRFGFLYIYFQVSLSCINQSKRKEN